MAADSPPPVAQSPAPHELVAAAGATPRPGPLLGREELLAKCRRLLATVPILALWGRPGIGKTSLGLAIVGEAPAAVFVALSSGPIDLATLECAIGACRTPPVTGQALATLAHGMERANEILFLDDAHHLPASVLRAIDDAFGHRTGAVVLTTRDSPSDNLPRAAIVEVPGLEEAAAAELVRTCSPGLDVASVEEAVQRCAGSPWHLRTWRSPTSAARGRLSMGLSLPVRAALDVLRALRGPAPRGVVAPETLDALVRGAWVELHGERVRLHDAARAVLELELGPLAEHRKRAALARLQRDPSPSSLEPCLLLAVELGDRELATSLLTRGLDHLPARSRELFDALRTIDAPAARHYCARAAIASGDGERMRWLADQTISADEPELAALIVQACAELGDAAAVRVKAHTWIEASSRWPSAAVVALASIGEPLHTPAAERSAEAQAVASAANAVLAAWDRRLEAALVHARDATARWTQLSTSARLAVFPLLASAAASAADPRCLPVRWPEVPLEHLSFRTLGALALIDCQSGDHARAWALIGSMGERGGLHDANLGRVLMAKAVFGYLHGRFDVLKDVAQRMDSLIPRLRTAGPSIYLWGLRVFGWNAKALMEHAYSGRHEVTLEDDLADACGPYDRVLALRCGRAARTVAPVPVNRDTAAYTRIGDAYALALDGGRVGEALAVLRGACDEALSMGRLGAAGDILCHQRDLAALLAADDAKVELRRIAAALRTIAEATGSRRFGLEGRFAALADAPDEAALHDIARHAKASPIVARQARMVLGEAVASTDRCDHAVATLLRPRRSVVATEVALDLRRQLVTVSGRAISFSRKALSFALLVALASGRETRADLARAVWGVADYDPRRDDKRIDVALGRVRALLGDDRRSPWLIITTATGYRWSPHVRILT